MWVTLRLIDAGVKSYICNYIPKKMALLLTDCVVFLTIFGLNQAYLQILQTICWRYSKDKIIKQLTQIMAKQISSKNDRHNMS
jgi:hypothetical protein